MITNRKSALLGLIVAALLWSTGGMLIKLIDGHALAISSSRAGIAAIILLIYNRFRITRLTKTQWLIALFYSLTVIQFVAANKLTTSANAIFLQFTAAIWVAIFSRLFLKTRLRKSDLISIIIIMFSLTLFFINKFETGNIIGNILGLSSGISFAGFIVLIGTQKEGSGIQPLIYGNVFTFLVGLPFYTVTMLGTSSMIGIILLGLFQIGISYIIYSKSMEYATALDGILIPVIEPILNPIWVVLLVHEIPSIYAIIGGIIMITTITIRSMYQMKHVEPQHRTI
ncbi:MAG: DMT family transporter [Vallitaleaceae bacterium]|jgi:drug/metabolite transporter (DMT)-like permease|nr:DMT family transporter [Vallitaleaceae bacterium]